MQLEFQIMVLEKPNADIWERAEKRAKADAIETLARLIAKASVNTKRKESDDDGERQD